MANIEKRKLRKGKIKYRAEVRIKGYPTQSSTVKTRKEAKDWAGKTETAIMEGKHFKLAEARRHTLGEAIDRYLKDIMPFKYLSYWKNTLGDYLLADISPALVAKERDALLKGNGKVRSGATVNAFLAPLSHLFSIAIKE